MAIYGQLIESSNMARKAAEIGNNTKRVRIAQLLYQEVMMTTPKTLLESARNPANAGPNEKKAHNEIMFRL